MALNIPRESGVFIYLCGFPRSLKPLHMCPSSAVGSEILSRDPQGEVPGKKIYFAATLNQILSNDLDYKNVLHNGLRFHCRSIITSPTI